MITIPEAIATAERGQVVRPVHAAKIRDEVLHWGAFASFTPLFDTAVPTSFAMRGAAGSGLAYVSWRASTTSLMRIIDPSNSADYGFSAANAATHTFRTMRSGVQRLGTANAWWAADHTASGIQLKTASLAGATNPLTISWTNVGPLFGDPAEDSGTRIRRVEAVCPTEYGHIVAVGTHDYTLSLSTIQFYWIVGSSAVALNATLQMPFTEGITNWYTAARHCTFITAFGNPTTGAVHVIANDQVHGRAVQFTIRSGIESRVTPVVPIDPEASLVTLLPFSVTPINGLFYLTARFSRRARRGAEEVQTSAFDLALISDDGWNWSLGERSSFLCQGAAQGAILGKEESTTLYYAGNGLGFSANATEITNPTINASKSLTDNMDRWAIQKGADTGNSFSLGLYSDQDGNGLDSLLSNPHVKRGATLYLQTGQDGTLTDFGVFGIDNVPSGVDAEEGPSDVQLSGRDKGSKTLIDYNSPLEMQLNGRTVIRTALDTLTTDVDIKTPQHNVTTSATTGLVYQGLNDPLIGLVNCDEGGDVLMKATVKMDGADQYHLAQFGFCFGMNDDGAGNLFLLPKYNNWTVNAKQAPEMRKLSLPVEDPDNPGADGTGWALLPRRNSLWMADGNTTLISSSILGGFSTRIPLPFFSLTPGTEYDVACRISGRRAQMYVKARVTTSAGWANAATWQLQAEFIFDGRAARTQAGRDLCGFAVSHDAFGDTTAFEQAEYGDLASQLTFTWQGVPRVADDPRSGFQHGVATGNYSSSRVTSLTVTDAGYTIKKGQFLRVVNGSGTDFIGQVTGKDSSAQNSSFNVQLITGVTGANSAVNINSLNAGTYWTYATAGQIAVNSVLKLTDPKAKKHGRRIGGRGIFITNDNSAANLAMVETDGTIHFVYSGDVNPSSVLPQNATGSRLAWGYLANPVPQNDFNWTGSDPSSWRLLMHHGRFFKQSAVSKGLPDGNSTPRYFVVGTDEEEEIIRYTDYTFALKGELSQETWCVVPTYYTPLIAFTENGTVFTQWSSAPNYPGDSFATIPNLAGMLVEISGRNMDDGDETANYYAVSASAGPPSTLTINKQYPNPLTSLEGVAVVSGRGQFDTKKQRHDAKTPVCYFPCDTAGVRPKITVRRFDAYSGSYLAVQDAIKRLAAISGMRKAKFRNRGTAPTGPQTINVSSSPQTVNTNGSVANFVLDMEAHIPGNSTNSSGPTGESRLEVYFRNYYRLIIQQYAVASDYAAGKGGAIRVALATTSTDISAPSTGDLRWLEVAPVYETDFNVSGTVSGSSPSFTLTEDTALKAPVRVIAADNLISVEINGKPIWTFNLAHYTTSTGVSLNKSTVAAVQVAQTGPAPSYALLASILELGDEVTKSIVARRGGNIASAIAEVTNGRHIRSRSKIDGGIEWGRYYVRDNVGPISDNLFSHKWTSEDTWGGHYLIDGEAGGEALDPVQLNAEGYQFLSGSNEAVSTIEGASAEALLALREIGEFSKEDTVEGAAYIELEPEDRFQLSYDAGGDMSAHASSDHVVTGITVQVSDDEALTMSLSYRVYKP